MWILSALRHPAEYPLSLTVFTSKSTSSFFRFLPHSRLHSRLFHPCPLRHPLPHVPLISLPSSSIRSCKIRISQNRISLSAASSPASSRIKTSGASCRVDGEQAESPCLDATFRAPLPRHDSSRWTVPIVSFRGPLETSFSSIPLHSHDRS